MDDEHSPLTQQVLFQYIPQGNSYIGMYEGTRMIFPALFVIRNN